MRSDLSILEELGASLAPAEDQPPADVRHRVMTGMRHPVGRPRLLSRLGGVHLAWKIGAPTVAAAAVAAVLVAGQPGGRPTPAPPVPGAGTRAGAGAAPKTPPGAEQVLLLAAQHAAATPTMSARPNQFLFIDSVEVESRIDVKGRTTVSGPLRTRTWLSVDGTHDGLVTQEAGSGKAPTRTHLDGCKNGRQAETIDRPETTPKVACTPEPAYRPGRVPTDADDLLAYVYSVAAAEPEWVSAGAGKDRMPTGFVRLSDDQRAFSEIAEMLYKNHLPAVQQAAFLAASRIPGVQLRHNATDAAGRVGVAVTRTEAGARQELVFNPTTYQYLGHNIIAAEFDLAGAKVVRSPNIGKGSAEFWPGPRPKPGAVIYKSALLRIAIVDKAGQRPG
ncbi:CU044_5270 family protein [Paractinoplanes globisporus]|uniref:CU044_5270 family protein n=1 Tax=Paractinoplanes globisporus TaxID=113565 RepID=A0ABW6WTU9_9ACTN|nr:CU044_5270 family protein [Actinoplanes globisporus]